MLENESFYNDGMNYLASFHSAIDVYIFLFLKTFLFMKPLFNYFAYRAGVEQCPEDEDEAMSEGEEQRKIREAQDIKIKQLIGTLKEKDRQLAALLEDKMATFCELVELLSNNEDSTNSWTLLGSDSAPPKYGQLLEHGFHSPEAKETLSHVNIFIFLIVFFLFFFRS